MQWLDLVNLGKSIIVSLGRLVPYGTVLCTVPFNSISSASDGIKSVPTMMIGPRVWLAVIVASTNQIKAQRS